MKPVLKLLTALLLAPLVELNAADTREQIAQAHAAAAPIVKDGQAACTIAVPDKPTPAVEVAADELVRFVSKATGVKLPVARESDLRDASAGTVISIGPTRLAKKAGLLADPQTGEFFAVRWQGDTAFLLGNDSVTLGAIKVWPGGGRRPPAGQSKMFLGSLDATVWFIENCLGGGYLFPGENGTSNPYGR